MGEHTENPRRPMGSREVFAGILQTASVRSIAESGVDTRAVTMFNAAALDLVFEYLRHDEGFKEYLNQLAGSRGGAPTDRVDDVQNLDD